jgi:hypothetical protein
MENEKLTLKELAPYLPYGLSIQRQEVHSSESEISKLKGISINEEISILIHSECSMYYYEDYIEIIKPILRPLSDLTGDIKHKESELNVIEEIYCDSWMAGRHEVEVTRRGYVIISNDDGSEIDICIEKPQTNEFWVFEILLKHHFDVFGLIDRGLAIDVNTLSK